MGAKVESKQPSKVQLDVPVLTKCILVGFVLILSQAGSAWWWGQRELKFGLPEFSILIWSIPLLLSATWIPAKLLRPSDPSLRLREHSAGEVIIIIVAFLWSFSIAAQVVGEFESWVAAAWVAAAATLSYVTGIIIAYRRRYTDFWLRIEPLILREQDLGLFAERILTSNRFITALQSVLPRPQIKQDGSLDQIPFLLSNINRRRASFERSSQLFFLATIVFGLLFVLITVWYGFVLIDQVPVGLPRHVANIRENVEGLRDIRPQYDRVYSEVEAVAFTSDERDVWAEAPDPIRFGACHEDLASVIAGGEVIVRGVLSRQSPTAALDVCRREVDHADLVISSLPVHIQDRAKRIISEKRQLVSKAEERIKQLATRHEELIKSVERIVAAAEAGQQAGDNRMYDLLKRISIGLIVVTFLLAILRYLTRQYSEHLDHMTRADQDDVAVRRFFVAMSNASGSEERSAAIKQFVASAAPSLATQFTGANTAGISDHDKKIVGEILEILKKRL